MTSNAITLDFIREAAEQQFASLAIETPAGTLKLRNPLRLSKDERAQLKASQADARDDREVRKAALEQYKLDLQAYQENPTLPEPVEPAESDEDEQFQQIADLLLLLSDDQDKGKAFIASLNKDIVLISTVIKLYNEAVSPGEA